MGLFDRTATAERRATGMLDLMGIDHVDFLGSDPVQAGARLRRRVLSCQSCAGKEQCTGLINAGTTLTEAPSFCRNKDSLDKLRP